MANQEHKNLDQLYQILASSPVQKITDLTLRLGLSKLELMECFQTLESMGLKLFYDEQGVKLNHLIDVLDLRLLNEILKSNNIKKTVHYCFSTASTNQLAHKNKIPSVFISDHQTQGKGRQNKNWVTPLGQSVALSISHSFNCGLSEISGLNIAIGVAIIQTTEQFSGKGLGLKWPNDLLGAKGKVAGILIEASGNNKACTVVIGIGINWNVQQSILDKVDRECMNVELKGVSRTKFMARLIVNIHQAIHEFSQNKLENFIPIWKKHDCYTDKRITIVQENTEKSAKYMGINRKGYLTVEMQGEIKLLASGEVTIRKVD